jgi:hypothetical protein
MYYNSKELQEYDPVFYYGCKTKPRNIIKKKNIPSTEYLFANLKKGEWNVSSDDCKKSQLLISRAWIDANMKSMVESRIDATEPTLHFLKHTIQNLQHELALQKESFDKAMLQESFDKQTLQFQLDNATNFANLKEEKYLLQIQLLQQK